MTVIEVPADPYAAADWLAARHPWVRQLAERIAGPIDRREDWLDVLTRAVNESDGDGAAWVEYERRHPAPDDDAAFWEWHAQGPQASRRCGRSGSCPAARRT
ncbi:hypothetical protein [Jiangella rhizosphaerae]|uniref:Uncharacterized protein n=1 Tax=Jiangella rhizosphaerae TaxID=2293569 RepID=A0A418KGR0_9ACTN|nr:hypothetical protein [Jiangella rhizosphaerae]RIQ11122.1 hypothetical protein DY240_29875 [Jiangella rhizosphaerae]